MRRGALLVALLLAVTVWLVVRERERRGREGLPTHQPKDVARVEPSPLSPWRHPGRDLARLFPPATNYVLEPRIVSQHTAAIQKKLGRPMHPDENPLRIHRVQHNGQILGSILVTRVKAEHGGIEIVTGVETNGTVRGVLIESQREPAAVAGALTNAVWLAGFVGKSATSGFELGADLPAVPPEARPSAQAIAQGVHDLLVVLTFAETSRSEPVPHH